MSREAKKKQQARALQDHTATTVSSRLMVVSREAKKQQAHTLQDHASRIFKRCSQGDHKSYRLDITIDNIYPVMGIYISMILQT